MGPPGREGTPGKDVSLGVLRGRAGPAAGGIGDMRRALHKGPGDIQELPLRQVPVWRQSQEVLGTDGRCLTHGPTGPTSPPQP